VPRDRELRVHSLSRVHLLGRYVSYRVMRERRPRDEPRTFTPEELRAELRIQETLVTAFDERFAHHPLLALKYEQLVDRWDEQIRRVQEFLGVEPLPLAPATKPNRGLYYRRIIANYDELAAAFADTRWSWLFVGPGALPPGR
jgi:hypothetical protein